MLGEHGNRCCIIFPWPPVFQIFWHSHEGHQRPMWHLTVQYTPQPERKALTWDAFRETLKEEHRVIPKVMREDFLSLMPTLQQRTILHHFSSWNILVLNNKCEPSPCVNGHLFDCYNHLIYHSAPFNCSLLPLYRFITYCWTCHCCPLLLRSINQSILIN